MTLPITQCLEMPDMARRDGTTKETLGQQTGANGDDFGLCQGAGNLDISQTSGGGGESNAGELYLTLDVVIFFPA